MSRARLPGLAGKAHRTGSREATGALRNPWVAGAPMPSPADLVRVWVADEPTAPRPQYDAAQQALWFRKPFNLAKRLKQDELRALVEIAGVQENVPVLLVCEAGAVDRGNAEVLRSMFPPDNGVMRVSKSGQLFIAFNREPPSDDKTLKFKPSELARRLQIWEANFREAPKPSLEEERQAFVFADEETSAKLSLDALKGLIEDCRVSELDGFICGECSVLEDNETVKRSICASENAIWKHGWWFVSLSPAAISHDESIYFIEKYTPSLYTDLMDTLGKGLFLLRRIPPHLRRPYLQSLIEGLDKDGNILNESFTGLEMAPGELTLNGPGTPRSDEAVSTPAAGLPTKLPDTAPELYADRLDRSEKIVDFLRRVWRPWMVAGLLTRRDLRVLDPQADTAVENWLRRDALPEDIYLPRKKDINDRLIGNMDVHQLTRLASAARRRSA